MDASPQSKKFPKCCVWRVTNAKAPFYLVGSIHALSKKDYPLPTPYDIALKDSSRFLFEFDPSRHVEFQKKFEAAARYPRGQDMRSKVGPELLAWLRKNIFTVIPGARRADGEQLAELRQPTSLQAVVDCSASGRTRIVQQSIRFPWIG